MKFNTPVIAIVAVITLTVVATAFRVSTAPERIRQRLDTAKTTCIKAGGDWVNEGRDALCQPGTAQK